MIKGSYRFLQTFFQPVSWLQLIFGGSALTAFTALSAYVAQHTKWITGLGPYAVFLAASAGAFISCSILAAAFWARYLYFMGRAAETWNERSDYVDPLALEYNRQRIKLQDIVHPATRMIERKRFIECELVGPAILFGQGPVSFSHASFLNCDWIVVRPGAYVQNAIGLAGFDVIGGQVIGCTILVSENDLPDFGGNIVTYTRKEIEDLIARENNQKQKPTA